MHTCCVLAADHLIQDQTAFEQAVLKAVELSDNSWTVTFGIQPSHAETGFGYLEAGQALDKGDGLRVAPDLLAAAVKTSAASRLVEAAGHRCLTLDAPSFDEVNDISFDYAVMQHSERVATIPCSIGWSDVGSWNSISELTAPDDAGNRSTGELLTHNARNNLVQSENPVMQRCRSSRC